MKPEYQVMKSKFPLEGKVVWIGLRKAVRGEVEEVTTVMALPGKGLEGDRFKGNPENKRQVTFIQAEHLEVVAKMLNKPAIDPSYLRRNIVVEKINLLALLGKTVQVGDAVLEISGKCYPCSRMEENLGEGGYNAMAGHGGVTAKVIEEGKIWVGCAVAEKNKKHSG